VAYLTANRSEGKLNFKKLQQSCITSLLTVLNNFIILPDVNEYYIAVA